MKVGVVGGSIAGCTTAALLHRVGHDVMVFERSESDLVSRGAMPTEAANDWVSAPYSGLAVTLPSVLPETADAKVLHHARSASA